MKLSLKDSFELHLDYEDKTPFGAMVSGQLEARLKQRFRAAAEVLDRGAREVVERGPALVGELLGPGASGELYRAARVVREDLAYPSPKDVRPAALRVERPGAVHATIALPSSLVPELASWLGEWQRGAEAPASGPARALWNALAELDCFGEPRRPAAVQGPATLVGHATVLLSTPRTKILIDPFLLPRRARFPESYQPLTHGDLAPDAALITHSHRDHFHIDSLLRLGKDTPIFAPEVPRESALSVDMVYRLKELGFSRARSLAWHEEISIGDIRVVALPFYGEQPTTGEVLSPDVRNAGNNYLLEAGGRRYAVVADAGRDHAGDVRRMATLAFERYGALDVLFGGYRAWSIYPIQYVRTSVPQYLVFTPPSSWGARQQIMNDAHALIDTAESWHARHVVPYADGGAPWYWELGLGPSSEAGTRPTSAHFDPRPEAVVRAAAERSEDGSRTLSSAVATLLMRPGESLEFDAQGAARVVPNLGHVWPYADSHAADMAGGPLDEPMGMSRKRVLLRMLAGEEMKRRGLAIGNAQVRAMSDDLRRQNGLVDHDQMVAWLARAGLSMTEYCEILLDWQNVMQLEGALADTIEKRVPGQRAFASMRYARRK